MKRIALFLASFLISASACSAFTTHLIQFGGTIGFTYKPDSLNVLVGDTIKWVGNFTQFPLQSISEPGGASAISVNNGDTFLYVIHYAGEYDYQNNTYATIGMKGKLIASVPSYGLTNEGKEFYLALITPSYQTVAGTELLGDFGFNAFISTYYDNNITISYFTDNGNENISKRIHLDPGTSVKLVLDESSMQLDTSLDVPVYKSCHIVSSYPITVSFVSMGPSGGGSYLALPVIALGRKYVSACFNDNPGNGAFYNPNSPSTLFVPRSFDYAGGIFVVIGTENNTKVTISPTVTTALGHPGANTGTPHPYTIILNSGQCYQVRSNGHSEDNDLSQSIITSDKPIAVISGHQDASLGSASPWLQEERDFMVEEMVPVEYWDNQGYISIPLTEGNPPGEDGHGDTYRAFTFDSTQVYALLQVQGITGGYAMNCRRLSAPPSQSDVISAAEAYSVDGKNFALMQFDQRSQTNKKNPNPAPSMMTVIPYSRWKTSYTFMTTDVSAPGNGNLSLLNDYFNVIGTNLGNIKVSLNNASPQSLSTITKIGSYNNISKNFPGINASQYSILPTTNVNTYRLFSISPFMVYTYGMGDFTIDPSYLGDTTDINWHYEFAAPAGMQLNTGVTPSFSVTTQQTCSGWHLCITDTGSNDPGIKAAILIDDPDGVYWNTPAKFSNVTFDQNSSDYADGELHPHWHTHDPYCFDVNYTDPLSASFAPMALVDNLGNAIIVQLSRSAPTVKLSTIPATQNRADSIVFPVNKIGNQVCTTIVVKNTASKGGTALNFTSVSLTSKDTSYKIISVTPSLPHQLLAGDSVSVGVCYTPPDSSRHQDSLIIASDCFSLSVSFDAHGSTGLISAGDLDFGTILVGDTIRKAVTIRNIGSANFTLLSSAILSDTLNFSLDTSKLPLVMKPGGAVLINIYFHPQSESSDTGVITWMSDLEPAFRHSVKDRTTLTGNGSPKQGVASTQVSNFSIHPNPTNGNIIVVDLPNIISWQEIRILDILGREVFHRTVPSGLTQVKLPVGSLSEGVYYVQFGGETERFVKVK